MKATYILLLCGVGLGACPAMAACEADFAQTQRNSIHAFYAQETAKVHIEADGKIRDAMARYNSEYYPEAKGLAEEARQKQAELVKRSIEAAAARAEYAGEAKAITQDYTMELAELRKDTSGRYAKEITQAKNDAKAKLAAIHEFKAQDMEELGRKVAAGCGNSLERVLRGLPKDKEPEGANGELGIRG